MKKSLPDEAYTELADAYASVIDTKPHNAYYDRPAVQTLLSNLKDKNILDAGCGTGAYTEWLINKGAIVTGIDANEKMLNHAKLRNGTKATFIHANLEESLSFLGNEIFDGIVSPLTVTYIRDQTRLFAEFNKVLNLRDGWFFRRNIRFSRSDTMS